MLHDDFPVTDDDIRTREKEQDTCAFPREVKRNGDSEDYDMWGREGPSSPGPVASAVREGGAEEASPGWISARKFYTMRRLEVRPINIRVGRGV